MFKFIKISFVLFMVLLTQTAVAHALISVDDYQKVDKLIDCQTFKVTELKHTHPELKTMTNCFYEAYYMKAGVKIPIVLVVPVWNGNFHGPITILNEK